MMSSPIFILFIGGIVLTVGDLIFKVWVERGVSYGLYYAFGVFVYLIGCLLLVESYKHSVNIGVAGMIQTLFNVIILIVFSYLYFHEPLTIKQIAGVVIGLVALFLMK